MKSYSTPAAFVIAGLASLTMASALAAGDNSQSAPGLELTGDTRLACEAILCLASGQRPHECMPSIRRYFSIVGKKPGDTVRERINFLKQCPASDASAQMQSLVMAQALGAGNCDAAALNNSLAYTVVLERDQEGGVIREGHYINNSMPGVCNAYVGHEYVDKSSFSLPRYVGKPERGGKWVEAASYERELAAYNDRVRREDAAARAEAERKRREESTY